MNKVILMGRITKDVLAKMSSGEEPIKIAFYTLAVQRKISKRGQQEADFIVCRSFGKAAEFMEKYGKKGMRFLIEGYIHTGSYQNDNGERIYTTEIITENIEFAESKRDEAGAEGQINNFINSDGFMSIPGGYENGIPFN